MYNGHMNAVKLVERTDDYIVVEGLGVPFGGPANGRDLDNQFFDKDTDFMLADYASRPLRYQHGMDATVKYAKIGEVKAISETDAGLWVQSQIDLHNDYASMIEEVLGKGALGYSSGAQDSAVKIDWATGHIDRWPIVEMTLTPTPANPYAMIASKRIPLDPDAVKGAALGRLLRRAQERKGFGNAEIAERSGLTAAAVSGIVRGSTSKPKRDDLRLIGRALGVSMDRMLGALESDGVEYDDDSKTKTFEMQGNRLDIAQRRLAIGRS